MLFRSPFIASLRKEYANDLINKYRMHEPKDMKEEFDLAHGQRIIGIFPKLGPYGEALFRRLISLKNLDTDEFVVEFTNIIKEQFPLYEGKIEKQTNEIIEQKHSKKLEYDINDEALEDQFNIGAAEFTTNIYEDMEGRKDKDHIHPYKRKKILDKNIGDYIIENFGESIVSNTKLDEIETKVCTDFHKDHKLHITGGKLPEHMENSFRNQSKKLQRENNIKFYKDNYSKINRSINKLSNTIKNTILTELDDAKVKSNEGRLDSTLIWRNYYLNDKNVFYKEKKDNAGSLTVDLLLDSSASQKERQEIVAIEGFIIAESLKKSNIKIRIWTFSSMKGFTILTLLKDYNDDDNLKIFNYYASAANRDGLAIKTILYLQELKDIENQVLIVLTDGKPNDERIHINTGDKYKNSQYTGVQAIMNTASEIRKGRSNGKSILGVFYGEDEDIDNAKLIYGNNFAKINNMSTFSDVVGKFLKEELKK